MGNAWEHAGGAVQGGIALQQNRSTRSAFRLESCIGRACLARMRGATSRGAPRFGAGRFPRKPPGRAQAWNAARPAATSWRSRGGARHHRSRQPQGGGAWTGRRRQGRKRLAVRLLLLGWRHAPTLRQVLAQRLEIRVRQRGLRSAVLELVVGIEELLAQFARLGIAAGLELEQVGDMVAGAREIGRAGGLRPGVLLEQRLGPQRAREGQLLFQRREIGSPGAGLLLQPFEQRLHTAAPLGGTSVELLDRVLELLE